MSHDPLSEPEPAENRLHPRRGAALVEFALVLPLILMLIVGAIDVGRAIAVQHTLIEIARSGARLHSVVDGVSEQDVTDAIDAAMTEAEFTGYTVELDPPTKAGLSHMDPVTVTVSVPYDNVSWTVRSWFMSGGTISASCVMPADTNEPIVIPGGGGGSGGDGDDDDGWDGDDDDGGGDDDDGGGGDDDDGGGGDDDD